MPFADGIPDTPGWVAWMLGVSTIALTLGRVWDWWSRNKIERDRKRDEARLATRRELTRDQQEADRLAVVEAGNVIDRLKTEIVELIVRIKAVEVSERTCFEKQAKDGMVLEMLARWAMRQRNPPVPADILARYLKDEGGSGVHSSAPDQNSDEEGS